MYTLSVSVFLFTSKGPVSTLVSRIGGFPPDDIFVPEEFLEAFINLAVQSPLGQKAVVELVWFFALHTCCFAVIYGCDL